MKVCTNCGISKETYNFAKDTSKKDNLYNKCKECQSKLFTQYTRTKLGLIKKMYRSQVKNSILRGHLPPEYSLDELIEELLSSKLFNRLYTEWVQSNYKRHLIPSIDRISDTAGYTRKNVQLMTWENNNT